MKKIFTIALLFAYLLLHGGLVMSMHLCGSAVSAVEWQAKAEKNCCCKKAKPCCETKVVQVKADMDETASGAPAMQIPQPVLLAIFHYFVLPTLPPVTAGKSLESFRAPPPAHRPKACILFRSLIFYA